MDLLKWKCEKTVKSTDPNRWKIYICNKINFLRLAMSTDYKIVDKLDSLKSTANKLQIYNYKIIFKEM